jgi:hypothetical protein
MASKNPFRDKLLGLPYTIRDIGVGAHQLIFPQETFGAHLINEKTAPNRRDDNSVDFATLSFATVSRCATLSFATVSRCAIANLTSPPLKFPVMIKRVVFPKILRRLEAFKPQAARHRHLFLI